ncbi:hypothetical protein B0J12DRAFT_32600 [Macrophomina phaseolina]|uniref:Uncharacterized protein n=1 Tax=Macrophomina phaseolina TaxID=35725 RepID=A0ABQ8GVR2_9PEZI|nr:hypothetical protein B0J12DRAFT_32600 [Macrophomina phaseolina]
MDGRCPPNPARNPAVQGGRGRYDKDFLLSFRQISIHPPAGLDRNLRWAGVTPPSRPPSRPPPKTPMSKSPISRGVLWKPPASNTPLLITPPPKSRVPSISVTPARNRYEQPFTAGDTQEEKHEQPFTTTDPMEQRRKIVTFLQNRTHERLAVQEERLKAKEAQLAAEGLQLIQQWRVLNQESTELLHQKMAFCQVRMILHNNCENPQNLPVSRFQHLGEQLNKEIDRLEKVRPNSTAHVLANLVGTPDRKDFGVKLQTKAEPSKEQPKTKTEHMVNAGKELATFF